jgi:hypothetical protein
MDKYRVEAQRVVVDIVAIYLSIRLTPQMFRHLDGNEVSKKSRPEVYFGLGLGLVTEQTSLTIWSIGGQYNIFVSMEALSRSVGMNTYSVQCLELTILFDKPRNDIF